MIGDGLLMRTLTSGDAAVRPATGTPLRAPIYRVFKNYGYEGWQPQGEDTHTLRAAVAAREDALANGGGEVVVVEVLDLFDVYARAGLELPKDTR